MVVVVVVVAAVVAPATVGTFKEHPIAMFKSILELCLDLLHSGNDNYNNSFSRKSLLLYFFFFSITCAELC